MLEPGQSKPLIISFCPREDKWVSKRHNSSGEKRKHEGCVTHMCYQGDNKENKEKTFVPLSQHLDLVCALNPGVLGWPFGRGQLEGWGFPQQMD